MSSCGPALSFEVVKSFSSPHLLSFCFLLFLSCAQISWLLTTIWHLLLFTPSTGFSVSPLEPFQSAPALLFCVLDLFLKTVFKGFKCFGFWGFCLYSLKERWSGCWSLLFLKAIGYNKWQIMSSCSMLIFKIRDLLCLLNARKNNL